MTWVTWGMSSPLAATSVATSTGVRPDRKDLKAYGTYKAGQNRSGCEARCALRPLIAARAVMPGVLHTKPKDSCKAFSSMILHKPGYNKQRCNRLT